MVKKALECGNIKKAAKSLGIDYQTLRNNHPELLRPYQRKSPLLFENLTSAQIAEIRRYAADPTKTMEDCAEDVIGSYKTLVSACRRLGIEWAKVQPVRKGVKHLTRNGKPTRWALEQRAKGIEPAGKERLWRYGRKVQQTP